MKKFLSVIQKAFSAGAVYLPQLGPIAALIGVLVPKAQAATDALQDNLAKAIGIIFKTEAVISAATGTEGNGAMKLRAAAPQIGLLFEGVIDNLELEIEDKAAAAAAITGITSNLADFLNACKKK